MKRLTLVLAVALSVMFGGPNSAIAEGEELRVDDNGAQCPGAHPTIQAAVNAAAILPGLQKIRICAGTYTENVSIGPGNPLQIFGDSVEKVTVRPIPGTAGPAFDALNTGPVSIEKLTVDGLSAMTGNPIGIRYQQTSGLVKDVAVLNIRDAAGLGQSVGIRINSTGPVVNARVEDNRVENWTRVGVLGNGPGVNIQIEDNLIIGPGPIVHAPNGVQVSRGALGLIKGNIIRNASIGLVEPNAGSGILLFCAASNTRVEGNKIFDSDVGINLEANSNALVTGNEVSGSVFDAYGLHSVDFFGVLPFPAGCLLAGGIVVATDNNVLEGNKAFNSTRDGVHLEGILQPGPTGNRILNTDIKGSGRDGIRVVNGAANQFINNSMEASIEHDAHSDPPAAANTWQDNDCKTPPPKDENQAGLCKD